jgi:carbonic anhydrase/acetyltransferase-like protein (isoleucine patch superfamily)
MEMALKGLKPTTQEAVFIAPSADIIGDVTLGKDSSVWYHATIRGDIASIHIGEDSNVQDNVVIHVSTALPTTIGNQVTIGHGAILHSCTIGDQCLIGMGAIILDKAVIAKNTMVAAGALVPPGKTYPPGSLLVGSPAKAIRELTEEEIADIILNAQHYVQEARNHASAVTSS